MVKKPKKSTLPRHYIREWRIERGLSQDELAEKIGYDRTYLSKIENGKKRYDQPLLEAVATVLETDAGSLIMRDPANPEPVWALWDKILPADRPQVLRVIETYVRKPAA